MPDVPRSVLDLVPVSSGSDVAEAVRNTVDLARAAERFGYHRRAWTNSPGPSTPPTPRSSPGRRRSSPTLRGLLGLDRTAGRYAA
ncbi:hypothetical protein [Amycolatopsis sp. lyj-109]|uniref:hypothetical protein n=1 Tax=Amycolatopsis sp. lyj-109 TaxID=2789287 RepID=UPI00397B4FE9